MPSPTSLTQIAHQKIIAHFRALPAIKAGIATDLTCGLGNDTLFLLQTGFTSVLAFDIQAKAIEATQHRCQGFANRLTTYQASHATLAATLQAQAVKRIDCAMMNLGYLPKASEKITTQADTTLEALRQTTHLLAPETGFLTVLVYPGHPAGQAEAQQVAAFLSSLDSTPRFSVTRYDSQSPTSTTPLLYCLEKHEQLP